jgi:hypothetical protein
MMSYVRQRTRQIKRLQVSLIALSAVIVLAVLIYLGFKGRTGWWPEADCTVVSSRVVSSRAPMGATREVLIMYRGEYGLSYVVKGKEHFVWADSGWIDTSEEFIGKKVAELSIPCRFRVQYNPLNPAESVAHLRR